MDLSPHHATPLNHQGTNYRKSKSSADVNLIMPFNSKPHLSSPSYFPSQPIKPEHKTGQSSSEVYHIAEGHSQLGRISLFTNQGQGMFSVGNNLGKVRPTSQVVNDKACFKMCGRNNSYRIHDEASREQVRGPRCNKAEHCVITSDKISNFNILIRRENFNKSDLPTIYEQALFFMIKSYSEDDIHRSIKYSVWSSTPNGNKKLDDAYRNADAESRVNGKRCPIFLFFSVNASGQFVGMAEMVGPVDFRKNMDFWQQDRWNGFFPVTWHIIKDIPNRHFQNIILENNDNKVVTFSRDTQEIRLRQGLNMLNIMKAYPLKTSILDDFEYYENRERTLCKVRSSELALLQSEVGYNKKGTSLNILDASFKKLDVCARPKETSFSQKSSFDLCTRNHPFNFSHLGNR
ncbi:hypothetical protein J5N97_012736 [Dioscorea zingiberensis]|uniref:YTH domain-containing family protein n=1 Tax=Dioscorea zingiberensis TaxID=325984 RepID=A0A9D5CRL7_9LILI|nr:hypothetical protein J5N97_012736 [Dioscorea zingiberensis]